MMLAFQFTQRVRFLEFIAKMPTETLEAMMKELASELGNRKSRK